MQHRCVSTSLRSTLTSFKRFRRPLSSFPPSLFNEKAGNPSAGSILTDEVSVAGGSFHLLSKKNPKNIKQERGIPPVANLDPVEHGRQEFTVLLLKPPGTLI